MAQTAVGRIINVSRGGCVLVAQAERAGSFWRRAIGLLNHKQLPPGAGLWIMPCGAVHTWGMRFSIDLLFLDRAGRVVCIVRNVHPWRMAKGGASAASVIEIATGWLAPESVACGDQVKWQEG